jgi:Na+/melibiose symporter-like transporter
VLNTDPTDRPSTRRPARNSPFLIVLIVVGAVLVALQYTDRALFQPDKTSMLWGMLTGLVLGGFLFGWLKLPWQD